VTAAEFEDFMDSDPAEYSLDSLTAFVGAYRVENEGQAR
jgi:hypothetical protein